MRKVVLLICAATIAMVGCGDDDYRRPAGDGGTTTETAPSTTEPTTATTVAGPAIPGEAVDFLDCDSLARDGRWWACRRGGGVAWIIEGGTAKAVFTEVRSHPDYNQYASVLFESGKGFVFLPGSTGFDQVFDHVGPKPGMRTVDTDLL